MLAETLGIEEVAPSRDEDHGCPRAHALHGARDGKTRALRKGQIGEHDVERARFDLREAGRTVTRGMHFMARSRERLDEHRAHRLLVLDHEDRRARVGRRGRNAGRQERLARGRQRRGLDRPASGLAWTW